MNSIINSKEEIWAWRNWNIAWRKLEINNDRNLPATLLIHGFGSCKEHWRKNQPELSKLSSCYSVDLLGFGNSSQPNARLSNEPEDSQSCHYNFETWGDQIADFCKEVIKKPVILIGNSIGGVIALKAAHLIKNS